LTREPREETPLPAPRDDAAGGLGPRRPRSPEHRPFWLVLLSSLTLIYGGLLLVSSLEAYKDPSATLPVLAPRAMTPVEEEIARAVLGVVSRVASTHAGSIRRSAVASLPVALLMLLAAAATMSRDRRGREIALAAAWTGVVHQVAVLFLTFPTMRDYAWQAAPLFARQIVLDAATSPDAAAVTPDRVAKLLMALPFVSAAAAIAGSFLLIRYFGGRRGRILYGLERRQP
jgi:hypothetical protein